MPRLPGVGEFLRIIALGTMAALGLAESRACLADTVAAVNEARVTGCEGRGSGASRLRANPRLDTAARLLARGDGLHEATQGAGYRATKSAAVHITHVPEPRDVQRLVEERFCAQALDRDLTEIGTYRRRDEVWMILAQPFAPPSQGEHGEIARRVLELTNVARSHARRCGQVLFPPVPSLTWAASLEPVSLEHSRDMAAHDDLSHTGHDGSSPADRVARSGYRWRVVGENVASGVMTPEEAVAGWVASPHHCENIMSPRFTQMAVSYAANSSSRGGIYWTQLFATPR